jgi:transglutaminase-like putative cysteine protease
MLKKIFALVFTIFGFIAFTFAGPPVVHVAPKPAWLSTYQPYTKDIPGRQIENGFSLQLSEQQVNIEKQASYVHIIRQIVSEACIQNGSAISVNFDPSYQRLDFHEIIVWRDGKPQSRLNPGLFKVIADEEELEKFIYQGSYSAYCTLPDIRKGDRLEFSYTITGRNPIFGNHYSSDLYLQGTHAIAHTYWAFVTNPQHQLNFKRFNTKNKFTETLKNGLKYYTMEDFQVKPAHDYDNQPDWYTNYAHLQITDFNSWGEVVNWALTVNPVPVATAGKVAAEVAALKTAAKGDKVKYFRSAVRFVQDEVRYMGIEMGEYSHRANLPENVLNHRYGDCKDKSLLLAALLTADSIPANLVLISTGKRQKTDAYLPSPTIFNHCVVTASVSGKQVWIDPTIAYQGGEGLNLYFPAYGQGLVLKPGNNAITTIPLSPAGKTVFHEDYIVKTNNDTADLKVVTRYELNTADDLRAELAGTGIGKAEKNYLEFYQRTYPEASTIDSLEVVDDKQHNVLTTYEHYSLPDFFKKDSTTGKLETELYAQYISTRLSNAGNKTSYPLALEYPANIDYTAMIVLPLGWSISDDSYNLTRDAFKFNFRQQVKGDTLVMNYHLQNFTSFVPIDKVDEYRADVKKIKADYLSFTFHYTPGEAHGGKYKANLIMIIAVLVFILLMAWLAWKFYTRPTPMLILKPGDGIRRIGGWLVVLAIGLCCFTLVTGGRLIGSPYFNTISLNVHNGSRLEIPFKAVMIFECFSLIFLVCLAAFCIVLLFKRRDIFTRYMIAFYIALIAFRIVDHIWAQLISPNPHWGSGIQTIVLSIIIAAIWISYLKRSARARETFIVPYPADNFVFEHELVAAQAVQPEMEGTDDTPLSESEFTGLENEQDV